MGCSILVLSSVVSILGGLVFGYELGIISGALLQLQTEFRLTCFQQEAVVSALLVGALLASLVGGCLIDRHGRKNSILFSNVLILGGSLVLLCSSFLALVVGRMTVGFAMCISSMSCCIFVSEMVSPKHRGLLVTLYEAGVTVGILAAYGMNYILADTKGGWKYMFGLAIPPTMGQLVSLGFLPCSARASVSRRAGRHSKRSLSNSIENPEEREMDIMSNRLDNATQYSTLGLFQRKDNMRSRTIIGLGLVLFQQFTGQPNVLLYASTIFHSVGFQSDSSAILASVGLGVVKVIATLVSMVFADRVGRRPLLIGGCAVMAVCLMTIGLLSGCSVLSTKRLCSTGNYINSTDDRPGLDISIGSSLRHLNTTNTREGNYDSVNLLDIFPSSLIPEPSQYVHDGWVNWIVLICLMAVVFAYSVGFGPMTWLILSEIFPSGVRGRAFAFTNCFNWAANLLVTFSFLNVIDVIGLSGMFLLYGLIGVAAVVFFYFMLPETKGKSLEEIDKELRLKRVPKSDKCCSIISWRVTSPEYQRVQVVSSAT
ncbi:solute carrier family 2, facilitated glucose transporter member 10 [Hypomesus transpacificus]|uniref:solute carrier family 2, facilitated glucose transporter member 10 n=1 Tax=Hypomesus transpacificus TaxID=137520 RepID=UPI001F078AD4|nr:solute carrier family 2, facilitated glucose transporter member 10 [Hypomesus transpacificus]